MQIIINIPKEMYQKIKETSMVISGRRNGKRIDFTLFNAVNTGTPLPKGHGRLIDETKIKNCGWNFIDHHAKTDASTIIEEESEDK